MFLNKLNFYFQDNLLPSQLTSKNEVLTSLLNCNLNHTFRKAIVVSDSNVPNFELIPEAINNLFETKFSLLNQISLPSGIFGIVFTTKLFWSSGKNNIIPIFVNDNLSSNIKKLNQILCYIQAPSENLDSFELEQIVVLYKLAPQLLKNFDLKSYLENYLRNKDFKTFLQYIIIADFDKILLENDEQQAIRQVFLENYSKLREKPNKLFLRPFLKNLVDHLYPEAEMTFEDLQHKQNNNIITPQSAELQKIINHDKTLVSPDASYIKKDFDAVNDIDKVTIPLTSKAAKTYGVILEKSRSSKFAKIGAAVGSLLGPLLTSLFLITCYLAEVAFLAETIGSIFALEFIFASLIFSAIMVTSMVVGCVALASCGFAIGKFMGASRIIAEAPIQTITSNKQHERDSFISVIQKPNNVLSP